MEIGVIPVLQNPIEEPDQVIFWKGDQQIIEGKIVLFTTRTLTNIAPGALGYDIKIATHCLE